WKTDDPAVRRRLEQTYRRDTVVRRVPMHVRVHAIEGGSLRIEARASGAQSTASWPGPLERARTFAITMQLLREQLGRLGDTPLELGRLEIIGELPPVMVPKSVLNDLRRQIVQDLLART